MPVPIPPPTASRCSSGKDSCSLSYENSPLGPAWPILSLPEVISLFFPRHFLSLLSFPKTHQALFYIRAFKSGVSFSLLPQWTISSGVSSSVIFSRKPALIPLLWRVPLLHLTLSLTIQHGWQFELAHFVIIRLMSSFLITLWALTRTEDHILLLSLQGPPRRHRPMRVTVTKIWHSCWRRLDIFPWCQDKRFRRWLN